MSRVDLEEMERLDKEATPGPFHVTGDKFTALINSPTTTVAQAFSYELGQLIPNAKAIAVFRTAMPAIIAELKAGRALVDNLECAIVSTIEAEASRVLVRSALRGFREATKGDG